MDLILWRHAEARDADAGEDDLDRLLTARGEKQARRMADWLNEVLPESTRVLVSPAQRTRQTADALGRKARISPELAPGAGVDALLAAVRWPTRREPVLVVGHQPQLGQVAAWLLAGPAALDGRAWTIRKGAIWWLRQRQRDGEQETLLVAVRSATGFGT